MRTAQRLPALLMGALLLLAALPASADWDIGDGDGDPEAAHRRKHADYERSEAVDEAAAAAILFAGKKQWLCTLTGPHRFVSDPIPGEDKLEDIALYSFKKQAITGKINATVRDLSVGSFFGSITSWTLPFMKTRGLGCEFKNDVLACDGGVVEHYVRHFTDPVGIVYLMIENTYAPGELQAANLPPAKSNGDRVLGSFYHCIARPI